MSFRELRMFFILAIVWGASYFFIRIAVHELPPLTVVALRLSIAAVALIILVRVTGISLPRGTEQWIACAKVGLVNNAIPFTLITFAETRITSSLASMLNATVPLFTVVVAHFFTHDERMTARRTIGVLIGFSGIVVMLGFQSLAMIGQEGIAQLASLSASLTYAFGTIVSRRQQRFGFTPMVLATGQVITASAVLIPLALLVDHPWNLPMPSAAAIASVLMLGLSSTVLAYVLFYRIIASAGATNLSLVTFVVPVVAALLGTLVLGERLGLQHVVGMTVVALGFAIIDGRVFHLFRRSLGYEAK